MCFRLRNYFQGGLFNLHTMYEKIKIYIYKENFIIRRVIFITILKLFIYYLSHYLKLFNYIAENVGIIYLHFINKKGIELEFIFNNLLENEC